MLGVVALVLGAVVMFVFALLRVLRDLLLRAPYPAPELEDPGRLRRGESTGECTIGESDMPMGGDMRPEGERQARDFAR